MNVDDLVGTVLRRKWATLAVLVLAVLAGYVGFSSAQTTFESRAALLIYPPGAGDPDAGLNPFVRLDNGIAQLGVVATTILQGDVAAEAFAATGATTYTVDNIAGDTASVAQLTPRLAITVTAPTAESAQAGAQSLLDLVSRELETVQRNAGQRNGTLAQTTVLNPPLPGVAAGSNAPRAAGAYAAAVLIPGLLLILGVSSYFDRRRVAKEAKPVKTKRAAATVSRKDRRTAAKQAGEPEPRVAAKPRTDTGPLRAEKPAPPAETRTNLRSEPDEPETPDPEPTARAWSAVDPDPRYPARDLYDNGRHADRDRDHRSWDEVRSKLAADSTDVAPEAPAANDADHDFVASAFGATRADPFFSADVATERLEIGALDRRLDLDPRDDEPVGWDVEVVEVADADVVDDVPADSVVEDVDSDEIASGAIDPRPVDPQAVDAEPADTEPADTEPADTELEAAHAADLEESQPAADESEIATEIQVSDDEPSTLESLADESDPEEADVSEAAPAADEPEAALVADADVADERAADATELDETDETEADDAETVTDPAEMEADTEAEAESVPETADETDETDTDEDEGPGDWKRENTPPEDRTPDDRAAADRAPKDRAPKDEAPRDRKPIPRKAAPHVDDYYGVDEEFDHGKNRDANSVR